MFIINSGISRREKIIMKSLEYDFRSLSKVSLM